MLDPRLLCHRCGFRPEPGATDTMCARCDLHLVSEIEHRRAPRDPFLGTSLGGKYPILGVIGRGGMGAVYRSVQPLVAREVAIKVILDGANGAGAMSADVRERFLREGQAIARLDHPAIVRLHDLGSDPDGTLYMVQELVPGRPLGNWYRMGGLSIADLLAIARPMLSALAAAHGEGIVHRDLKPDNIMVALREEDGRESLPPAPLGSGGSPAARVQRLRVKILDFGLVKVVDSDVERRLTRSGLVSGTPHYMSPEQATAQPLDHRSDLYSLAVLLWEGLAGHPPFRGANLLAILMPRIQTDPPKLPSLPGQPKGLQAWLLKGMARKPEDRFQSAGEMLAALEALGPGGDDALPFALPDDFDLGDAPSAAELPPPAGGLPPPVAADAPSGPPPPPGTSDLGPPLAGEAHSLDFGAAFGDLSAPLAASILPELSVPKLAPEATPPPPHLLPEVASGPGGAAPPVAVPVARPIRPADPRAPTEPAARAVAARRRSSKPLLVGLGAALAVGLVVSMAALSDSRESAEASEAEPSKRPASGGPAGATAVVATPVSQAAEPVDAEAPPAPSAWRISAHAALSALPWSPHAPLPMALGDRHACAVGRTGAVRCWGSNLNGALGDGTQTPRATPAPVVGLAGGAARVASGAGHACAVLAGGEVRCWGANDKGQLGTGGQDRQSEPVAVNALPGPAAEVAAGSGHTCALTRAGSVWCWGANDKGQLGDGTTIDQLKPVEVAGLEAGVVSLAAHASQTCVLIADATDITRPGGEVRCWGDNEHGELGDGRRDPSPVPVKVEGLDQPVVAISVGTSHACAAMAGGGARCWGGNSRGQLGDGTAATRRRAVAVAGPRERFKVIAAGGEHTCALTEGGAVRCWGLNMNGQLGDGTSEDHRRPVSANGLETGVQGLVVGGSRTCVRGAGDTVMCWGANAHGQLGDGSTTDRNAPTEVLSGCCD